MLWEVTLLLHISKWNDQSIPTPDIFSIVYNITGHSSHLCSFNFSIHACMITSEFTIKTVYANYIEFGPSVTTDVN